MTPYHEPTDKEIRNTVIMVILVIVLILGPIALTLFGG